MYYLTCKKAAICQICDRYLVTQRKAAAGLQLLAVSPDSVKDPLQANTVKTKNKTQHAQPVFSLLVQMQDYSFNAEQTRTWKDHLT